MTISKAKRNIKVFIMLAMNILVLLISDGCKNSVSSYGDTPSAANVTASADSKESPTRFVITMHFDSSLSKQLYLNEGEEPPKDPPQSRRQHKPMAPEGDHSPSRPSSGTVARPAEPFEPAVKVLRAGPPVKVEGDLDDADVDKVRAQLKRLSVKLPADAEVSVIKHAEGKETSGSCHFCAVGGVIHKILI